MKKKRTNLLLILLFIIGFCIMMYPTFADQWNKHTQTTVVHDYEQKVEEIDDGTYERLLDEAHAFNERIFDEGLNYETAKQVQGYEDVLDIENNGIMGFIEIPKIGVKLPIYHGTHESNLAVAVGHLKGTSLPVGGPNTHAALSSHRGLPSARLFTDLDQLEPGDTFTVTVLSELLTYQVEDITIVEPQVVRPLDIVPGRDLMTLVTCTPYGINTHRMLVRAARVDNTLNHNFRIVSDARRMDPLTMAPVLAVFFLILLAPFALSGGKRNKKASRSAPTDLPASAAPVRDLPERFPRYPSRTERGRGRGTERGRGCGGPAAPVRRDSGSKARTANSLFKVYKPAKAPEQPGFRRPGLNN